MFVGSLARRSGLEARGFGLERVPRAKWKDSDFVVGEVIRAGGPYSCVELCNGRLASLDLGDQVLGALGKRAATLETCGDWELIGEDGEFDQMTPAGLFGKETSRSYLLPALPRYRYMGHVMVDGHKCGMRDYALSAEPAPLRVPVLLIVGTSMSAGKTATGKALVRQLKALGRTVVAAKLTGAGRYRDILSMKDAGADEIFDFVDAGLPSTVCPESTYCEAIAPVLHRIAALEPDVLLAEVGASPMEPYNGEAAVELLKNQVQMSVLCASDPYAVLGVMKAFNFQPDLISGPCTNTSAGEALLTRLTGLPSVNILAPEAPQQLRATLTTHLTFD